MAFGPLSYVRTRPDMGSGAAGLSLMHRNKGPLFPQQKSPKEKKKKRVQKNMPTLFTLVFFLFSFLSSFLATKILVSAIDFQFLP